MTMIRLLPSIFLLAAILQLGNAEEPTAYGEEFRHLLDSFTKLQMDRMDYRNPKQSLEPEKEQERLRLLGKLHEEHPLWVLSEQLTSDVNALESDYVVLPGDKAVSSPQEKVKELLGKRVITNPANQALIETLKKFKALVERAEDHASNRDQAERFAKVLRRFIVRQDLGGATKWVEAQ